VGAVLKNKAMANIFDKMQDSAFDIVTNTMGYDATWIPSSGGGPFTARVLFKDPTEIHEISGVEYNPHGFMMEYRGPHLPGLFEAVRDSQIEEVEVNGIEYYVRDVKAMHDGRTYRAKLDVKLQ
jgi:hypothetical protein